MDGFFAGAPLRPIVDSNDENIDRFAQAIAGRFNNADRPLLTARLSPVDLDPATPLQRRFRAASSDGKLPIAPPPTAPDSPMNRLTIAPRPSEPISSSAPSSSAHPPSSFSAMKIPDLSRLLQDSTSVLILDIRAHSAHGTARIPHAISLSVPSTLLKRPAFTLHKLSSMLSSAAARKRFNTWDKVSQILVYDADSTVLSESSNLLGLLRKFRNEGFKGELAWLHGGIQTVWKEQRDLIDCGPLTEDEPENDRSAFLRARDLPVSAFTISSTMGRSSGIPTPQALTHSSAVPSSSKSSIIPVKSSRSSGPAHDSSPMSYLTAANPFYDNIRQNRELSHGMTERIPLQLAEHVAARIQDLPFPWLKDIASHAGGGDSTESLAMQFYRIELGEQRRLQGVMDHHSRVGKVSDKHEETVQNNEVLGSSKNFAFSILAGFEKGNKNRYRNIWPFEHARVKLQSKSSDDYINASYVQPLSTRRRYIATQGPLPSTFTDFWTIVWEQNVRVVVMLTKQWEGGNVKCGQYWADGHYGPLQLKCISSGGALEEDRGGTNAQNAGPFGPGGGYFSLPSDGSSSDGGMHNNTIRRVFEIRHTGHPAEPPRVVRQLQYVGWPDMDVPPNPKGFLKFMSEVDMLVDSVNSITRNDIHTPHESPLLLHCSAGVGRTGSFIVIDAILDGVRREIRKKAEEFKANLSSDTSKADSDSSSPEGMELDTSREASMEPATSTSGSGLASQRTSTPTTSLSPISPKHEGPTATLHVGGTRRRGGGNDIHVPVVSAAQEVITPRAQRDTELPSFLPSPSSSMQKLVDSPSDMGAHNLSSSPRRKVSSARRHHRVNLHRHHQRRVVTSDFTEADADSMFTDGDLNPAFAMDVESVRPVPRWASTSANENSSSGEGTGSGGDFSSGSGASARNKFIAPIAQSLARMSSGDDIKVPNERVDSLGRKVVRLSPRGRAGSGSGSGSGSGEGASMSSSSGRGSGSGSGSLSGSGRGSGSSFASSSSLGLNTFAFMGISPADASGPVHNFANPTPTGHNTLLEPKPMHPLQQSDIIEASLTKKRLTEYTRLKHHSGSSHSHSSSSALSTDFLSSASSPQGASSETPISTHEASRASSESSMTKENMLSKLHTIPEPLIKGPANSKTSEATELPRLGYDFVEPRPLHKVDSPPLLSSLEEPVREVLEDMREQRMSLCQSLRQYIFVHNAIIEGSLRIIDEERRRAGISKDDKNFNPIPDMMSTATAGKRGPSPTELSKEDKKGDVALAKRPSFRRGQSTSSVDSTSPS